MAVSPGLNQTVELTPQSLPAWLVTLWEKLLMGEVG